MKRVLVLAGIVLASAVLSANAKPEPLPEGYYANFGVVTEVGDDYVIFMEPGSGTETCPNGMVWSFYGSDWEEGDRVSAIMCDNGTPSVLDDEVVEVKYNGNVFR